MELMALALAPIAVLAVFYFIRDRYEKEPKLFLALGLFWGFCMAGPILAVDVYASTAHAPWVSAFLLSAANEEGFKWICAAALTYQNRHFNEPVDGIIYCVFVSLGFAAAENLIYVFSPLTGGLGTAVSRAVLSVPAHGLFGVEMGYFFGLWRYSKKGSWALFGSWIAPWLCHGLFNWILLGGFVLPDLLLWCGMAFLWADAMKKLHRLLCISPFRFLKYP